MKNLSINIIRNYLQFIIDTVFIELINKILTQKLMKLRGNMPEAAFLCNFGFNFN
jgi:hypothetical protein